MATSPTGEGSRVSRRWRRRPRRFSDENLPHQRVHLAGYSFAGRLAFELGRQMAAAGQPPLAIVIIDTAATSRQRHGRTWRDLGSIAINALPSMVNEALVLRSQASRASRVGSVAVQKGNWRDEHHDRLNQVFNLSRFPEAYQRRLRQSRQASAAYLPRVTNNRVFYLRSRIRSLIHAHQPDGGWGAVVPPELLTVRMLPSDHGSALHALGGEPFC